MSLLDKKITILTPTTGKKEGLERLISSINNQINSEEIYHILLWDDKREVDALSPESYNNDNRYSLYVPGELGKVWGSHLRAVGMNAVQTPYTTFADDDVWWDDDHYETIRKNIIDPDLVWGGVRRKIWNPHTEMMIGVDNFESIGYSTDNISVHSSKIQYEMLDGNCMTFKREYGVYAAPLYREIDYYGDDRLLYGYLKENASECALLTNATINQKCPVKLVPMFESLCD